MHKIIEFVPTLLRIVMQNDVDISVRLAGSIYLKNSIIQNWQDREIESGKFVDFHCLLNTFLMN